MIEGVEIRALSADEQEKLLERSVNALLALKTWKKCMGEDGEEESDMEKMLQSAIDIFTELRRQWAISIGKPQEISGTTLQKILDASLRILREEIRKGRL